MQDRDDSRRTDGITGEEYPAEGRSVYDMTAEYDAAEDAAEAEAAKAAAVEEEAQGGAYGDVWQEELNRESRIPQVEQEEQASLWSSLRSRIGQSKRRREPERASADAEDASSGRGTDAAGRGTDAETAPGRGTDAEPVSPGQRPGMEIPQPEAFAAGRAESAAYAADEDEDWDDGAAPEAGVEYTFDADFRAPKEEAETPAEGGDGSRYDVDFETEHMTPEERSSAWIRKGSAQEREPQRDTEEEEPVPAYGEEPDAGDEVPEDDGAAEAPAGRTPLGGLKGISGKLRRTVGQAFGRGLQEEESDFSEEEEEEEDDSEEAESKGHLGIDGEEIPMPDVGARLLDVMLIAWGFISEAVRTTVAMAFNHVKNEIRPENLIHVFSRYLLGFVVFYYELVLKFCTTKAPLGFSIFYILLYSIGWGLFGYLLTSFLKPRANRLIRKILIPLMALPYLVEYFVYRQFKYFFSPAELAFGMGNSMKGHLGDVFRLVFNSNGLLHIVFFLVPVLLYLAFVQYWDKARRVKAGRRLHTLFVILVLFVFTWVLILCNGGYRRNYSKEYTFNNAVPRFGLLTSYRLEARNHMFGGRLHFEEEPAGSDAESASDLTEEITRNALDVNFGSLAGNASGAEKEMDLYLTTHDASAVNDYTGMFRGKNLILITAESFHGDLIEKNLTPTLYRLSTQGMQFADYSVPAVAGSAGGEYEVLFGMYPLDGVKSLTETAEHHNVMTIGSMLTRMGYWGKAYTNQNYTADGRSLSHMNLGYSEGYAGYGSGLESGLTDQSPRSDLELFQATVPEFIGQAPFNVYYMTNSGAGNYTKSGNAMSLKNWGAVEQIQGTSDTLLSYISANLELENALAYLMSELERTNQTRNTVIALTSNTYPYMLDGNAALGSMPRLSELYGYSVDNALQRDHNTLILWSGDLEGKEQISVREPVSAIDLLPTLANLFGTEWDSRLFPGRDIFSDTEPLVFDMDYNWKTDKGSYLASTGEFTPTDTMEVIDKGYQKRIKTVVRNKVRLMRGMLETDYMSHVFAGYTFAEDLVLGGKKRTIVSGTTAEGLPAAPEGAQTESTEAGEEGQIPVSGENSPPTSADGAVSTGGETGGTAAGTGDKTPGAPRDWSEYLNATGE